MEKISLEDLWKCSSFLVEVDRIFHFSALKDLNSFSEEDYQFLLYLIEHWKRLLALFPSVPEIEIPKELLLQEKKFNESEEKNLILRFISEIRKKFKYMDEKFDFQYLENQFFQKYEDIQLQQMKT
ncbi:MAG: hypothetical protein HWN79_02410 [Candidatus Lokiarchaeota archaeon]|nr:hypothetical protein [Candidatus Lokiarchaeota archaeon]